LALTALAALLVGLVLIATQPVSGQAVIGTPPAAVAVGQPSYTPAPVYYPTYAYQGPVPVPPDPELGKLLAEEGRIEREAAGLVEEYSRTEDESQRSKTKAKLAATLEKQFDLQQKRRDMEVARIETQLKKLRETMRKRNDMRQSIIDKRLDQLLREADGLGWTAPPPGAPGARALYYSSPVQVEKK
jgi:hypothetical protein